MTKQRCRPAPAEDRSVVCDCVSDPCLADIVRRRLLTDGSRKTSRSFGIRILNSFGIRTPAQRARYKHFWRPEAPEPALRSLPLTRPSTPSSQATGQHQSPLFVLLPVEIRLLIWEHVLGRTHDKDALHLDIRDGILRYRQCYEKDLSKLGFRHTCWGASMWWRQEHLEDDGLMPHEPPTGRGLLSLLLTCKLM